MFDKTAAAQDHAWDCKPHRTALRFSWQAAYGQTGLPASGRCACRAHFIFSACSMARTRAEEHPSGTAPIAARWRAHRVH